MDSFELSTDTYNPSELRRENRRKPLQPTDSDRSPLEDIDNARHPFVPDDIDDVDDVGDSDGPHAPAVEAQKRTVRQHRAERRETEPRTPLDESPATSSSIALPRLSLSKIFTDGRPAIFLGVLLILFTTYLLVASISYIANEAADQSALLNSSAEIIKGRASQIKNTTGWVGAFLSHFLIYRSLGLGSFILILYTGVLGLCLVGLCHIRFWSFTFKCLVSAIAVSLIAGLATFASESPTFWGGEHGYYINKSLIDNASLWSAVALGVAMLTALILIFLKPLVYVCGKIGSAFSSIRGHWAARHDAAIAAAHRTEVRKQAERAAAMQRAGRQEQLRAEKERKVQPEAEAPAEKPAPLDELFSPLAPSVPASLRPAASAPVEPTAPGSPLSISLDVENHPSSIDLSDTSESLSVPAAEPATGQVAEAASESVDDSEPTDSTSDELEPESPIIPADTPAPPLPPMTVTLATASDDSSAISLDESEDEEADEAVEPAGNPAIYDPHADLSHYTFPSIDLLRDITYDGPTVDEEEQEANKIRITNILRSYGVEIASISATIGPTITLYEIIPAPGVRISKIKRLGDDVALSLAAMGIRIIAPMPGKGTIGMEVPNKKARTVSMRSIIASRAYRESKAQLPIALGNTISNDVYVTDLAKMPHLLVAGATGMGKSVGLNTIIASLLYSKHPSELKFVLVDPKMVEFSLYRSIERHYLAKLPGEENAIITQPENVVATLNSLCKEMDDRYQLLSDAGVRGLVEYNAKFVQRRLNPEKGHRFLPYIVVIIDEFADLILTVGKEVEIPISRLAAKARAIGIHVILATQRPSVNVITGVIKANFPSRMAFRVTQRNDSQTIIDRPGAEQLIGRGDMLISRNGIIDRVQCAFIDTPEVEAICNHIASQQAYPSAYELPEITGPSDGAPSGSLSDRDPLFAEAGREVIAQGVGSTSSLQRKFNIGYPRAGKIMDQLELAGVVGPTQGGKPRAVLVDLYSFERYLES